MSSYGSSGSGGRAEAPAVAVLTEVVLAVEVTAGGAVGTWLDF